MSAQLSPRELLQWLLHGTDALAAVGVRAVHGYGPDLGDGRQSSWISFASELGTGRLVRGPDGTSKLDALRHADGAVLLDRSSSGTTADELGAVVDAITPTRRRSTSAGLGSAR